MDAFARQLIVHVHRLVVNVRQCEAPLDEVHVRALPGLEAAGVGRVLHNAHVDHRPSCEDHLANLVAALRGARDVEETNDGHDVRQDRSEVRRRLEKEIRDRPRPAPAAARPVGPVHEDAVPAAALPVGLRGPQAQEARGRRPPRAELVAQAALRLLDVGPLPGVHRREVLRAVNDALVADGLQAVLPNGGLVEGEPVAPGHPATGLQALLETAAD
mmetsp:Transcript_70307/g.215385  ORF Transcript_70307/g.215385 Transcript_70307/m.215385 type:complete len:216 (+) Transcript_70307:1402-2049(+)